MSWREAARLSDVAYTELAFQAIYAFRAGNLAPPGDPHDVVARARRRVAQSKAVVSFVLALVTFGAAVALHVASFRGNFLTSVVSLGTFDAGVLTGLLALEVAFLWWTGMQVLPTFLSSGALPVLETLPIDDVTMRWTAGLLYVRLFDLPALTVLVATPLAIGLVLGWAAGLAILPGAIAVVALSLALSLITGRFFLRRVQGSRSGGGRTLVRWSYLVLWLIPVFSMFVFVIAAPAFLEWLGRLTVHGPTPGSHLLLLAFPFPLAVLPTLVANGPGGLGLDPLGFSLLGISLAAYAALSVWSLVWVLGSVRRVGLIPPLAEVPESPASVALAPARPVFAVLIKDLRIASRTPGYAFLILLPVLDAIAIGLLTYVSPGGTATGFSIALAAVTTAAILATFFGPAFFAIEVFAYSYGRTLPIRERTLVGGKVLLVMGMYLVAAGTVLGISLARIFDPAVFAVFIFAELPAVAGAGLLELGLLFRRARSRGLPITNLYANAWTAFLVSVPGVILAGAPLLAYRIASGQGTAYGLEVMALVALAALALALPIGLGRGDR
jgi:predicted permease